MKLSDIMHNLADLIDARQQGEEHIDRQPKVASVDYEPEAGAFTHNIIQGTIDVTTGGNVNFMVSRDQNTPVTWTNNAGSYVRLMPLGAIGANTTAGTWS